MKKLTLLLAIALLLAANVAQAQTNSNWTYNTTTTKWEKDITPSMFQFSTQTTSEVQSNIITSAGGGNPSPTITTSTGQNLSNGYFVVTGGQVSNASEQTLTNVRIGYNVMNGITLGSKTGNFLRLATSAATITEGTKSVTGGYFNWNWYISTKYTYATTYTLVFKNSIYQETANIGLKFSVVKEDGTSLLTDKVLGSAGWNEVTFSQPIASGLPFRFKTTIPNTAGYIVYTTTPQFLFTSATKPAVRTITETITGSGTVTKQFTEVLDQDQQVFTITPAANYSLSTVTFGGSTVTPVNNGNGTYTYTTPILKNNTTLNVVFTDNTKATDYFRSQASGNWTAPATWQSSPDNGVNWYATTLTPTSSAGSITVQAGNTVVVDADATAALLTVQSTGQLTISGSKSLTISNKLDNAGTLTVNGTLQLNTGGWVTSAPFYGTTSTLKYNTGGTYSRGNEWTTTGLANVTIANNTTFDYPKSNENNTFNSTISGNLTIEAGSAFYMDYGSGTSAGSITVGGNITVNGTLSLGDAIGGDIFVGGNWSTPAGSNFNANSRAVNFNGTTEQTISNAGNASFPYMTIKPGAKVTLLSGNTLTVTNLTIESNAGSGTGTFMNNGTFTHTEATVQQQLGADRNWYVSSPVAGAAVPAAENVWYYNEQETNLLNNWVTASGTLTPCVGYIVNPTAANTLLSFTGALNSGDKSAALTRTNTKTKEIGFNLVGNPYPSYLNAATLLSVNSALVESNVWYRTHTGSAYQFQTYNASADVSVPQAANPSYIPPMQSFWVRVLPAQTSGSLSFTDAMRMHNTSGTVIPFKAPAAATNQILRLQVSNGTAADEAVIYFNANAAAAYDSYDSPKMMNNGTTVPNIYTTLGTENLVINGMNAIPYDVAIPLSIQGDAGTYTVTASEFSNFAAGDKVMMVDNGVQYDLTSGSYTFSLTAAESAGRFALVFPKSGVPTGVDKASAGTLVFVRNNRIVVSSDTHEGTIFVYNQVGQRLAVQTISGTVTEINRTFPAGVYVVKVNNRTAKVVVR